MLKKDNIFKKLLKKSTFRNKHRHYPSLHPSKNDQPITLKFRLTKTNIDFNNEKIHICGSLAELGDGIVDRSPRMVRGDDGVWTYDLTLPFSHLERSKEILDSSFVGNPQGYYFTFNYVVDSEDNNGRGTVIKFEEVPKRGLSRTLVIKKDDTSSASSSSSSSTIEKEDEFLSEVTFQHTWSTSDHETVIKPIPISHPPQEVEEKNDELSTPIKSEQPISNDNAVGSSSTGKESLRSSADIVNPKGSNPSADRSPLFRTSPKNDNNNLSLRSSQSSTSNTPLPTPPTKITDMNQVDDISPPPSYQRPRSSSQPNLSTTFMNNDNIINNFNDDFVIIEERTQENGTTEVRRTTKDKVFDWYKNLTQNNNNNNISQEEKMKKKEEKKKLRKSVQLLKEEQRQLKKEEKQRRKSFSFVNNSGLQSLFNEKKTETIAVSDNNNNNDGVYTRADLEAAPKEVNAIPSSNSISNDNFTAVDTLNLRPSNNNNIDNNNIDESLLISNFPSISKKRQLSKEEIHEEEVNADKRRKEESIKIFNNQLKERSSFDKLKLAASTGSLPNRSYSSDNTPATTIDFSNWRNSSAPATFSLSPRSRMKFKAPMFKTSSEEVLPTYTRLDNNNSSTTNNAVTTGSSIYIPVSSASTSIMTEQQQEELASKYFHPPTESTKSLEELEVEAIQQLKDIENRFRDDERRSLSNNSNNNGNTRNNSNVIQSPALFPLQLKSPLIPSTASNKEIAPQFVPSLNIISSGYEASPTIGSNKDNAETSSTVSLSEAPYTLLTDDEDSSQKEVNEEFNAVKQEELLQESEPLLVPTILKATPAVKEQVHDDLEKVMDNAILQSEIIQQREEAMEQPPVQTIVENENKSRSVFEEGLTHRHPTNNIINDTTPLVSDDNNNNTLLVGSNDIKDTIGSTKEEIVKSFVKEANKVPTSQLSTLNNNNRAVQPLLFGTEVKFSQVVVALVIVIFFLWNYFFPEVFTVNQ